MDSWTLQGDSYSFLRSAPRTFSLCHRDGTPNHVEIFDIINIPSQRSAISETTCLCDIFGDDCESASLSSSPAVGPFVPSQREVDGTAAASPLLDELNDSSGSYHTAQGSSEGEEGFEDSRDKLYSPPLQRLLEAKGLSSSHPEVSEDSSANSQPRRQSPAPQLSTASPSFQNPSTGERTPSPEHNSPCIFSPERRLSSLSSSSAEKRPSSSSPDPKQTLSEPEPIRTTPSFKDSNSSPSHQSLTPSPSLEPRNCISQSCCESVNPHFLPEFGVAQDTPEPKAANLNQNSSPAELPSKDFSQDFTESAFELRTSHLSPSPSPTDLLSNLRETPDSPELSHRSSSSDTQASSPFPDLRGRISLPDLFSRGSTPEIKDSPRTSGPSTAERETAATPESQRLSVEAGSSVSTPGPRYTPPSPVISKASSPELVEGSVSPDFRNTAPSPGLLSAASLTRPGSTTPSPERSPEIRQATSPVVSYSLSPSPAFRDSCSPIEHRYTSPSPEIRITASSPEVGRKEQPVSASPLLEPLFDTSPSRSLTSSPHITGISYSVVQPEDRSSPPFPELSHLPVPEPDNTPIPSEERSLTTSRDDIAESIGCFTSSAPETEKTLLHHPKHQTPSPQPNHQTPSPEPRFQSPSPQHKSRDPSPAASPHRCQLSPATLSADCNPPLGLNTLLSDRDSSSAVIAETQSPTYLRKESVPPSFETVTRDKSPPLVAEIKGSSPAPLPLPPLPILPEGKLDCPLKLQREEREETPEEVNIKDKSGAASSPQEKTDIHPLFFQREDTDNNLPSEINCPSPNLLVPKKRSPNLSPVHGVKSNSPAQPLFAAHSPTSDSSSSLKSTSETSGGQLLTKVRPENRERFTEDMSHHANRRRTPSPPLTRFTPVHIIAPEKPYRQWQNRSRSPTHVGASSPRGNLKKAVTNRESPDNNSQAHWVSPGRQLGMERGMPLEQERQRGRERQKDREMERNRKREEQVPETEEEGSQGDTSYRGEQVELSFSARNRKGPASRGAAPTSRETRQGLPTAHSYSESSSATRQLQQQQSVHRLASQQATRGCAASRRPQPPAPRTKSSAPRHAASYRPGRSSSSSMGSELDEADDEVKWFTDVAFRSLSSPDIDYLDMYNSSHHSSANISQPSTQESPAGIGTAWQAYADFRGSVPKLDHDELSSQQPSAYFSDGLDPSRRYELGSFECVDVAVEREDSRKLRRGVPKRQIQLKKRNDADGKQDGSSGNSSPGLASMVESYSQASQSRGTFVRQQSTPAAMHEHYPSDHSPEPHLPNVRKSQLQKSASMDETCTKTQMASCLIKNVLSKKMQSADKQPDEQAGEGLSPTFEKSSPPAESQVAPLKESPRPDIHDLSSSFQSDYSLSSESIPMRGEPSAKDEAKPPRSFGVRPSNRPSSSSSCRSVTFSLTDSEEADSQSRNAVLSRSEMRSELKVPFDSKQRRSGEQQADYSKTYKREGDDSANATETPSADAAHSAQFRPTMRGGVCESREEPKQLQQGDNGAFMSKTQEIKLKAVGKKKASLNVCLTPEAESKSESTSPDIFFRQNMDEKTEEEDGDENNKAKGPLHKVRDVRRLVKNTYNLSFKASSAEESVETADEKHKEEAIAAEEMDLRQGIRREERREERAEEFMAERTEEEKEEAKDSKMLTPSPPPHSKGKPLSGPQPIQIEYKAVCLKEDKNKTSRVKKDSENLGDKSQVFSKPITDVSRELQSLNAPNNTASDTEISRPCEPGVNITAEPRETLPEIHKVPDSEDKPAAVRTDRKHHMLGNLPKMPSKEREVSTAVVLIREGPSKTRTSASPAQEMEIQTPILARPASISPKPTTPGSAPATSGHSVSMLLKEKGYQADIGAVVGDSQNVSGVKGVPRKHVNSLEIPLQTVAPSDGGWNESHRERTFSSSSTTSVPSAVSDSTDATTKTREDEGGSINPAEKDTAKLRSFSQEQDPLPTKQRDVSDFEAVKRLDPTFPPRSPAIRRFKPQPIQVKSMSKEPQKKDIPTSSTGSSTGNSSGNSRPQIIEVKSIAKNSQKPVVPPKPNCKFKPADFGVTSNEAHRSSAATSTAKSQSDERTQTIVVSSPTIYRKISTDSTATSNYSRKLAVSAVSSLKPPPSKTTSTASSSLSNQSAEPPDSEATCDRGQMQQPAASPQTARCAQKALTSVPTSTTSSSVTSAADSVSDPIASQTTAPASAGVSKPSQPSQPAVMDRDSQLQYPRAANLHQQQTVPLTSNNTTQPTAVSTTQLPRYTHQPCHRSLSSERSQRTDDLHFYASDDPPSYDERESFSPLTLPDLTPLRSNRFQPSSRPPACPCTAGCPTHIGLHPPHHHRSPHNLTPPAPTHSPGQALPYAVAQPPLRPHQCRPDAQPMSYQPGSPKSNPFGPSQQPTIYQPLHQPAPCAPHPSLMQACSVDRSLPPPQHIDPRRPPVHRSPHQQPPGLITGAPYSDPSHNHSPGLPSMDPQFLCGTQSMAGPSYGSEYGGDSSSLYSESSYGQTPRRVLLDPETGKYFYIEVPVQPLRKMLFDPETGQYVEVLIPQQTISHSGLYPPSAAPYPPLPNPSMYAPAPQYMPYAAPAPPAQPQPPRYPEASAAATMHPSGSGVGYRNPSGQGSKPEPQNHPSVDHSYLESMYYVPTGMNTSPNPTPPDYYHKHPPNLPPTGGKRS